jgi:two-component system, NarL family, nitrate/nitrite response regulator NarL
MKLKEKTMNTDGAESAHRQGLMKILLVDDSPFFLKAATRFLSELGTVTALATAHNGADAVRAVLRERPDLVLIDLNMPGMSGLAAVRRIKAVAPELRVVVVSLNESSDFRAAAEAAGADGYIAKRDFATGVVALFAAQADPQD